MLTKKVDITNKKVKLIELLSDALAGKEVILTRDNKPVARLVPIESESAQPRKPGLHPGAMKMSPNFDEPLGVEVI
jgi:antitoxin (DNA-binding transcriptional repressor) of toxin-antitoxin stability system